MSNKRTPDDWQTRASAMMRRQRSAWIGTIVTMGIGFGLFLWGAEQREGAGHTTLLLAGIALNVIGMLWGTLIYMQVIDEQERDANLWATYGGLVVYMVLFVARFLGDVAGVALPLSDIGIFLATMIATLAVFTWKRFF